MKRQITAMVLLLLFCLTNVGVVVGAHTCLKSNHTEFSLFPRTHSGSCCEIQSRPAMKETLECVEETQCTGMASGACTPPAELEQCGTRCCAPAPSCVGRSNTKRMTEQHAQPQLKEREGISFNSSCTLAMCAGESCCRVDQVALLDLHVRTLPEKKAIQILWLSLPKGIQLITFAVSDFSNSHVGIQENTYSLPKGRAASRLQVWRL